MDENNPAAMTPDGEATDDEPAVSTNESPEGPAAAESEVAEAPVATRRQRLVALLNDFALSFDDLRRELAVTTHQLESDLRHVEKSIRREGQRFDVRPASCTDCGFVFEGRETKHFHAPSRCPRCRSERIADGSFRIVQKDQKKN